MRWDICYCSLSVNQLINQSINQSITHSINQTNKQTNSQSFNRSFNQCFSFIYTTKDKLTPYQNMTTKVLGSIFAAFFSLECGLRSSVRGRSAGSFPEQRLVIEPIIGLNWVDSQQEKREKVTQFILKLRRRSILTQKGINIVCKLTALQSTDRWKTSYINYFCVRLYSRKSTFL